MSYAHKVVQTRASPSRLTLLPFLGLAILLSALRLLATTAALRSGSAGGTPTPTSQTWLFAAIWIAAYFLTAVAGWLLWRRRHTHQYGRAALVIFWVQLGLQGLRLLNLLGSHLTAGLVPWSAFGTVVLLAVVVVVNMVAAWPVSRPASAFLAAVLGWLLFITALTGADALLQNGLPLT